MHRMSLGNLTAKLGLKKDRLLEAAKLGLGAFAFPLAYGMLRTHGLMRLSAKYFAAGTPVEMATRGLSGVVLGSLVKSFLPASLASSFADGMAASALGSVATDLVAPMLNSSAAAVQAATTATEQSTGQTAVSGMNPMGRGIAGVAGLAASREQMLFGAGTPDLRGAQMFNGANVAIESSGRGMASLRGATVAVEAPAFAGALMA